MKKRNTWENDTQHSDIQMNINCYEFRLFLMLFMLRVIYAGSKRYVCLMLLSRMYADFHYGECVMNDVMLNVC